MSEQEHNAETTYQKAWRPYLAYTMPPAFIFSIVPLFCVDLIPSGYFLFLGAVFAPWLSFLTVCGHHRGREKRTKAGTETPGLIDNLVTAAKGKPKDV